MSVLTSRCTHALAKPIQLLGVTVYQLIIENQSCLEATRDGQADQRGELLACTDR
jgi:hypothetical protein